MAATDTVKVARACIILVAECEDPITRWGRRVEYLVTAALQITGGGGVVPAGVCVWQRRDHQYKELDKCDMPTTILMDGAGNDVISKRGDCDTLGDACKVQIK